ncbi:MAG: hypothetical protein GDA40_09620 [Rhodobacteraceae bacterium]|nr:hypothetical protein [Paracoccaceae bacterium]
MPSLSRSNLYLGLVCLAFAALLAFVWGPLDATTGLAEKIRNHLGIGDGLAPTVAAVCVGLGGTLLIVKKAGPLAWRPCVALAPCAGKRW